MSEERSCPCALGVMKDRVYCRYNSWDIIFTDKDPLAKTMGRICKHWVDPAPEPSAFVDCQSLELPDVGEPWVMMKSGDRVFLANSKHNPYELSIDTDGQPMLTAIEPTTEPEPSAFENWSLSEMTCSQHRGDAFAHCRQCRQGGWNAAVEAASNQLNQLSWDREIIEDCQDRIRKLEEKPNDNS